MEVQALQDVLLQDWQSDTGQKFEDVEEVFLVAVASGGELHWELCGELYWIHGWWVGSMEVGSTQVGA